MTLTLLALLDTIAQVPPVPAMQLPVFEGVTMTFAGLVAWGGWKKLEKVDKQNTQILLTLHGPPEAKEPSGLAYTVREHARLLADHSHLHDHHADTLNRTFSKINDVSNRVRALESRPPHSDTEDPTQGERSL